MVPARPSGPVSLYGVPLPINNCNLPFLFPLMKSKCMKSVIGNEKTRSLYKVKSKQLDKKPVSVCRSVVQ